MTDSIKSPAPSSSGEKSGVPITPEEKAARRAASKAASQIFTTKEEALKAKPAEELQMKLQLFRVTDPDGNVRWTYAFQGMRDTALARVAKGVGWSATADGKAPDKAKVADMLSRLSDEDRSILIAQYVPPSESKPSGRKGSK